MEKVKVRSHTATEAFLIAVILFSPKYLGLIATVIEEQFENDDNHLFIVSTDIVTQDVQESKSRYA